MEYRNKGHSKGVDVYVSPLDYAKYYNVKIKRYRNGDEVIAVYDHAVRHNGPVKGNESTIRGKRDKCKMDEKSVESSMGRTKQKIFDYAKENEWEYFVTLTFNPAKVERTDYEDCSNKLRHWLNHLKARVAPDLRYMVVPEFHEDGKSYHFHGLISHTGNMEFVNSGKTTKDGDIIYNLGDYALGWTTATKIKDTLKASRYITEYITKELCAVTQNKKRYWRSNNLKLPKVDKLYYEDKEAVSEAYAKISSHTKTVDVPAINNKVTYYNVKGDKDDEIENSDK